MIRRSRIALAVLLLGLVVVSGLEPAISADEAQGVTLHVLGARVHPLKPKGKPWDADHSSIPFLVYHQLGGVSGFPPLTLLSLVPYRNRPDPYVVVEAKDVPLARSSAVQGSFLPTWGLEVPLPPADAIPAVLTFRVVDDDLRDDDVIGKAIVDAEALLAKTGLHRLEGSAGLFDLTLVVRNPGAKGAGPEVKLTVKRIQLKVREQRPAGGDWDAGGNPLRKRLPKIPWPKEIEGAKMVRPDIQATVAFGSARKSSDTTLDSYDHDWKDVGLTAPARTGIGDGVLITVTDKDLALSDPIGALYVPFEKLAAAREKGVFEVKADEESGIEKVTITFAIE